MCLCNLFWHFIVKGRSTSAFGVCSNLTIEVKLHTFYNGCGCSGSEWSDQGSWHFVCSTTKAGCTSSRGVFVFTLRAEEICKTIVKLATVSESGPSPTMFTRRLLSPVPSPSHPAPVLVPIRVPPCQRSSPGLLHPRPEIPLLLAVLTPCTHPLGVLLSQFLRAKS